MLIGDSSSRLRRGGGDDEDCQLLDAASLVESGGLALLCIGVELTP